MFPSLRSFTAVRSSLLPTLRRSVSYRPAAMAHGPAVEAPKQRIPLTFVSMEGRRWEVEGIEGETLLETAGRLNLPIPGSCSGGGAGAALFGEGVGCRNCHVYVDNEHVDTLPPKSDKEQNLTKFIKNKNTNSRFACEIIVEPSVRGMTIVIPDYPERA